MREDEVNTHEPGFGAGGGSMNAGSADSRDSSPDLVPYDGRGCEAAPCLLPF